MLKTILVDDEQMAIQSLQLILKEFCPDIELSGSARSPIEAVKLINQIHPDLVFLDIEMPNGTGFDVLDAIPDRSFDVVFVTAYNHYALKAIKFSAADYILKPVDIEEIIKTVDKVKKRRNQTGSVPQDLQALLMTMKQMSPSKIAVPTSNGTEFISVDEILYVTADRSYCQIFLTEKRNMVVSKSLSELEIILPSEKFYRLHKSHTVNLNFVKKHLKTDGGIVELTDGTKLYIARNKKDEFSIVMQNYLFQNHNI
jgi:two-component system LytT family response regulator